MTSPLTLGTGPHGGVRAPGAGEPRSSTGWQVAPRRRAVSGPPNGASAWAARGGLRVFVLESRELFRAGLRLLLEEHPKVRVVGEAGDAGHALRSLAGLRPDVLVLAESLRGESGLALLPRLLEAARDARAVVLSDSYDPEVHRKALASGAAAVLVQHASPAVLFEVLFGSEAQSDGSGDARNGGARAAGNGLTRREAEISELAARGLRNREIAERLFISEATVRRHLTAVFRKTGARDRVALALWAGERMGKGGAA